MIVLVLACTALLLAGLLIFGWALDELDAVRDELARIEEEERWADRHGCRSHVRLLHDHGEGRA